MDDFKNIINNFEYIILNIDYNIIQGKLIIKFIDSNNDEIILNKNITLGLKHNDMNAKTAIKSNIQKDIVGGFYNI